jgi:hypothetical protein
MPPCRSAAEPESGRSEPPLRRSAAGSEFHQPQLPMSSRRSAVEVEPGQAVPESLRRPSAEGESGQSRLPMPLPSPVAEQALLPKPLRSSVAEVEAARPPHSPVGASESGEAESLRSAAAELDAAQPPRPPAGASESGQAAPLRSSAAELEADRPQPPRPPAADGDQSLLPMAVRPPAPPVAAGLLAQARRGLAEAERETDPAERFIGAYLAALRGAAAVLAARGRPHRGRARPASTWVLLDSVAPELREWSAFFAGNSATRAAAQAGITGKVTAESAAGLVRAATPFLELVRRLVHGLPITGEAHVA